MGQAKRIAVDHRTHSRLDVLARRVHRSISDIVGTLSYADYDMGLGLHARRADAERPAAKHDRNDAR